MNGIIFSAITLLIAVSVSPTTLAFANGWEEDWKKKVIELAQQDYVISATKEMIPAFSKVREENGLDSVDALREELATFYADGFAKEYTNHAGEEFADLASLTSGLDDDSVVLQHYYMTTNANPVGSKHLLDQGDDKSTWSKLHGQHHPKFREYLEAAELHDIFLVDLESADIIYSVFKEIDFTTNVVDGPYAETFADAFQEVKDADAGFASTFFNIYAPSYDEVAYFFMAPVFEGDKKIGAVMIQVPL